MRPCWANQSTSCGPRASGRGTVSPLGPVGSGAGGRSRRSGAVGRRVGREVADEHQRPAGYVNPVGEMPARSDRRRRCRSTTCTPPRAIHVLPRSHPLPESRPQRTAAAAATEPATLPRSGQPRDGEPVDRWRRQAPAVSTDGCTETRGVHGLVSAGLRVQSDRNSAFILLACSASRAASADPAGVILGEHGHNAVVTMALDELGQG